MISIFAISCSKKSNESQSDTLDPFQYKAEQFADIKILRYSIPGFEVLNLQQKKLLYYLSEAALCGRDILFDQHYKHNLTIRRNLENIFQNYKGDRETTEFKSFEVYLKRVWFSSGIHHHYSTDKFFPEFSAEYFKKLIAETSEGSFPLENNETTEMLAERIIPIMYNSSIAEKRVNLDPTKGLISGSASNFYENINDDEAEKFYDALKKPNDISPVEIGHLSKLIKENGTISEKSWNENGMYGRAIEKIIYWLTLAKDVAENEHQKIIIKKLIQVYKSGDLVQWDDYNISWLQDTTSQVDFVNGFIEVYSDPIGLKGSWESVVNFRDEEASKRTKALSQNAQWFEDNSPVDVRFKKKEVKGISAKVVTMVQLGGDCYPSTPIGINLPNNEWIRKSHGSKSVTISNIMHAYNMVSLSDGTLDEFVFSTEEKERAKKYASAVTDLHVDLHECLGHGSGQLLPGVKQDALKNYHSTLEEARADLFALYYGMDAKIVELGLLPNMEAGKTEYDSYIRGGLLTQLTRIELGKDIEEAHMRNRQLIAKWAFEKGRKDNVIELFSENGNTYTRVNDYTKLRDLFGQLLAKIQRIKSEGDYDAAKILIETYGIKVDQKIHAEILERYKKLNLAPYSGFINPILVPVIKEGKIIDVNLRYDESYANQMMRYSKEYSYLPNYN